MSRKQVMMTLESVMKLLLLTFSSTVRSTKLMIMYVCISENQWWDFHIRGDVAYKYKYYLH